MTLYLILVLYLCFRAKQLVCDFFLQTTWMALDKGKQGTQGYKALTIHALIHGVGTTLIFVFFLPSYWWMGLVDVAVHGTIDRIKARITEKYNWTVHNKSFWWAFGLDQEAHNLTHLVYIIIIIINNNS